MTPNGSGARSNGGAPKTEAAPDAAAPAGPKRDLVGEFKKLQSAEKVLGIAAACVLLGFVVANLWTDLFSNWFYACALLGSVGALVLTASETLEIKLLEPKMRTLVLLTCACLPALGFVIETLYNTWTAMMLAGAGAMAWAAIKIILRDE